MSNKRAPLSIRIENMINLAIAKHGDKFNYSRVHEDYINRNSKVWVECKKHGWFKKSMVTLTHKGDCPKCVLETKLNKFITKAKKIHNNKYDYSRVHEDYINNQTKVLIGCPKHGWFRQDAHSHCCGCGCGCSDCNINSKASAQIRAQIIIQRLIKVHNNKYDYSRVHEDYINRESKVFIGCPEHGWFKQQIDSHLERHGCPDCSKYHATKEIRLQYFIKKAIKVHNNKYDYTRTHEDFKNNHTKVLIGCPEHGFFRQSMDKHLHGHGCLDCTKIWASIEIRVERAISNAKEVHGDRYDFSRVHENYKDTHSDVWIGCPEHGWVISTMNKITIGWCPKCDTWLLNSSPRCEHAISLAIKTHGDRYNYDRVHENYKDSNSKVWIGCPEHNWFKQSINSHTYGHGCPVCNYSHMERVMSKQLNKQGMTFEPQKTFDGLFGLGGGLLSFDFYLPNHNIAIECDGPQHHRHIPGMVGDISNFNKQQEHDKRKNEYCKVNGIRLIRLTKADFNDSSIR